MTERPRRMREEVGEIVREQNRRKREVVRKKKILAAQTQMPEHEVRYYVEEIEKYGSIPSGLTKYQLKQIREAMA